MKINRNQNLRIVAIAFATVAIGLIINILSPDAETWCRDVLGENYKRNLLVILPVLAISAIVLSDWQKLFRTETIAAPEPVAASESIHAEIRKYLKSRYKHRLAQKLASRQPVNLRKIPSRTGTSDEGAASFITLREEEVRQAIGDIFTQSKGRLLVVGLPGAGKTTLLLQLALELLERAEKVPAALSAASSATKVAGTVTSPIPVLLNLATWRSEFATFDEWLQRILPLELGASKALAEKIRRNTPLILLLDGLDEVPEAERASCLEAIGQYGMHAENQYVISSRIAEYAATKDAPVYVEVEVAPLTITQVEEGLIASAFLQPESKRLLTALKNDSLLRKAVENPFYFNTAQLLFASGKNWSDFGFTAEDVTGRQRELVERFVEDALGRKVRRDYPKEKARKWLGFLAGKMEESGTVNFELVDVQPNWAKKTWKFRVTKRLFNPIYSINVFFLYGFLLLIFVGIETIKQRLLYYIDHIFPFYYTPSGKEIIVEICKLMFFLTACATLIHILIQSFIIEPIFVYLKNKITNKYSKHLLTMEDIENLNKESSSLNVIIRYKKEIISTILLSIVKDWNIIDTPGYSYFNLERFKNNLSNISISDWAISLIFGILGSIYLNFLSPFTNINIFYLGLPCSFLFLVVFLFQSGASKDRLMQLQNPYERFQIALKSLNFSVYDHFVLRCIISLESSLPLRLVTFLNEMSLRHLLEFDGDPITGKGGGAWRWRHRIVQEYFLDKNGVE